jgi:hypothetical protein
MTKRDDSLIMVEGPDRVNYATGVLLNADDFVAEQNYHRGRLARALAYVSGSGTAAGLEVRHDVEVPASPGIEGNSERIMIDAGLAIDRLGRLIEVPQHLCLRIDLWYQQQNDDALRRSWFDADTDADADADADAVAVGSFSAVVVDVFIRFIACERGKTPAFSSGPFDTIDAVTAARLRDGYQTELVLREEAIPPIPQSPWPDFSTIDAADRPEELRRAIFDAWQESTSHSTLDGLAPLAEHAAGQDTSSVFLARLLIPADAAVGDGRPQRRDEAIVVDNDIRPFVVSNNALARLLEIF